MNEELPVAPIGNQAWHAGLSVGNALLDKQHIVLAELIRSLQNTQGTLDDDAFNGALRDILRLARRHCAAEEHLLALNGYEWLEQHREEHFAGLDRLHSICTRRAQGDLSREHACAALATWIGAHLVDMDLPALDYLRHRAGVSDEAAESLDADGESRFI